MGAPSPSPGDRGEGAGLNETWAGLKGRRRPVPSRPVPLRQRPSRVPDPDLTPKLTLISTLALLRCGPSGQLQCVAMLGIPVWCQDRQERQDQSGAVSSTLLAERCRRASTPRCGPQGDLRLSCEELNPKYRLPAQPCEARPVRKGWTDKTEWN